MNKFIEIQPPKDNPKCFKLKAKVQWSVPATFKKLMATAQRRVPATFLILLLFLASHVSFGDWASFRGDPQLTGVADSELPRKSAIALDFSGGRYD